MVKKTISMTLVLLFAVLLAGGCGSNKVVKTGFLSDYSRLRKESNTTLRHVNTRALAKYSIFMVDPVKVHFHRGAKAVEHRTKGKLTQRQITDLTNYMHAKLVEAVRNSGNRIAYQPGAGVARIRAAITDIDESTAVSLVPQAKLAGIGIGGASMEAEIVDSMTGEQIAAIVESRKGSRIPFANLGQWDAAKQVVETWAKNLQKRL